MKSYPYYFKENLLNILTFKFHFYYEFHEVFNTMFSRFVVVFLPDLNLYHGSEEILI